ncbi:hypothetical protein CDAR_13921 [Caerostris darwini]|uniref:Uncharacterized protein n=1 Tax=Caerostris darwini TaxID=1538125 RepID=A0AAV4N3Y8_9ARAC|nr:hypothetical protein CDAR_13921 [Caerostris darwini]
MLICQLFEIPFMQAILHPYPCRNETISQHTISLHFVPEKQYAFSAKNTLPFQYQSYSSFAQSLNSRLLPNIRARNFNPARNAKPDNGTPPKHVHVREVIRDDICSLCSEVKK